LTVPLSLGFLQGQPAFMKTRGYEIAIVTSSGPGLREFGEREGVAAYPVEMPRRISPGQDLASLASLAALVRKVRPAIVHAHTPKGGLLGILAATLARVPRRIYHMRGLPLVTAHGAQRAILGATERTSCTLATKVIAVSHSLRETAIAEKLVAPSKIRVLAGGSGQGVDADRFDRDRVTAAKRSDLGIPEGVPVVGFVGRLVRDKGIVELVEAMRAVPDAHLLVVGDFEERDPVPAETRRAIESDPRIHVLGFRSDTPPLYAAMDVVALPTYREGFPNVPLEAASMRLPIVASRVPGCTDAVVDGETGTLVPARDATALGEALARYVGDRSLRDAHGNAGRARVEKSFRRERIWEALADLYDEMLTS